MVTRKRWRGTSTAATKAAVRKRAKAAAVPYLTGEKVRRYESPKMIAQHGRAPWPPAKAAKDAHDNVILNHNVSMKYPEAKIARLRTRKTHTIKGRGWWQLRKGWTLRKANVSRDKKTGEFRARG